MPKGSRPFPFNVPRGTPMADMVMGTCGDPDCDCVHFLMFDENRKPIARTVLTGKEALELVRRIQDTLYERATDRD